jgi:site-specific recombinase XerD
MAITVKEALDLFELSMVGNVAEATRESYEKRLKGLREELGHMALQEVTIHDLRRWYAHASQREEGEFSPWTLHGLVRSVRRFFNWCVEDELLTISPAAKLRKPRLPDAPPKAVSDEDLVRLLKAADYSSTRDFALLCFFAETGCRIGGVRGLNLRDLNLDQLKATIREKGRGGGKTRTVYFTEATAGALEAWLEDRDGVADELEEAVFVSWSGTRLTKCGIGGIFRRLAEVAGVEGRHNPHAFRHAFARRLLQNGADLGTVSRLMGHSDIIVTHQFYGRWSDTELEERYHRYGGLPAMREKKGGAA